MQFEYYLAVLDQTINTMSIFLQIVNTAENATETVAAPIGAVSTEHTINLFELIMKGGWVMVPLFLLSFLAIFIIIERYLTIRRASRDTGDFMPRVKAAILQGDVNGAKLLCASVDSPVARMIEKGVSRLGRPLKDIETSVETVGRVEVLRLERNINILGIVASIAPMLGFVGTISGVIKIFYNIAQEENISIGAIAEGLYEKMITSASGLVVGIIAYIGYHLLNLMIERIVYRMEQNAMEFVDLLQENK